MIDGIQQQQLGNDMKWGRTGSESRSMAGQERPAARNPSRHSMVGAMQKDETSVCCGLAGQGSDGVCSTLLVFLWWHWSVNNMSLGEFCGKLRACRTN